MSESVVPQTKPSEALLYLQALLRRRASIDIEANRVSLWRSRLNPVLRRQGLDDLDALVQSIRAGSVALEEAVVDAMTTNETMFFRDGPVFEDIVTFMVPRLMAVVPSDGRLTIWSAACSSGQEVYSLAMHLDMCHPELVRAGRIRLLASDLSHSMVERCRAGRYSSLEVRRGLPDQQLRTYFERDGEGWVVGEKLRDMVLCRQLNLMESLAPIPRCELVLIRNVLIYFSDQDRAQVLGNIRDKVLRPDGALVLGSSELIGLAESYYQVDRMPNGVAYRPRR